MELQVLAAFDRINATLLVGYDQGRLDFSSVLNEPLLIEVSGVGTWRAVPGKRTIFEQINDSSLLKSSKGFGKVGFGKVGFGKVGFGKVQLNSDAFLGMADGTLNPQALLAQGELILSGDLTGIAGLCLMLGPQ